MLSKKNNGLLEKISNLKETISEMKKTPDTSWENNLHLVHTSIQMEANFCGSNQDDNVFPENDKKHKMKTRAVEKYKVATIFKYRNNKKKLKQTSKAKNDVSRCKDMRKYKNNSNSKIGAVHLFCHTILASSGPPPASLSYCVIV